MKRSNHNKDVGDAPEIYLPQRFEDYLVFCSAINIVSMVNGIVSYTHIKLVGLFVEFQCE